MEIDVPSAPVSPQLLIMRMKNLVVVALLLVFHFRVLVSVVSFWSFLSLFFALVVNCVGSSTRVSTWSPIY